MAVDRALHQANATGCEIRWPVDGVRPPFLLSAVLQASDVPADVFNIHPVRLPRLRGRQHLLPGPVLPGPGSMKELNAFC